ncbi:MAG: hypothetical protein Q7K21_01380 [Elusimicrobiota bacterium]|nr:hypothetical protein [Elusimicrobiota bacterium]
MKRHFSGVILLLLFFAAGSKSKIYAVSGADFIKLGYSAFEGGLSEAVSVWQGRSSVLYNPANIYDENFVEFSTGWLEDAKTYRFSSKYGRISFLTHVYTIDPIPVTNEFAETIGNLTWNDYLFLVSYGFTVKKTVKLGVSLKNIYRQQENPYFNTSGTGYAFDMGGVFNFWTVNAGMSVQNIGSAIKYSNDPTKDYFPKQLRVGINKVFNIDYTRRKIGLEIDSVFEKDQRYLMSGLMYYTQPIYLLLGYKKSAKFSGISFGVGLGDKMKFAFADTPLGDLYRLKKFEVTYEF